MRGSTLPSRVLIVVATPLLIALGKPTEVNARLAERPPGYTKLVSGNMPRGSWEMSGQRVNAAGHNGICLHLWPTYANGTSPGHFENCFAGELRAADNVVVSRLHLGEGSGTIVSVVGGMTVGRARTARIRFADGRTLRVRTTRPPRKLRRVMRSKVSFFATDALATTSAKAERVRVYDRTGRMIASSPVG